MRTSKLIFLAAISVLVLQGCAHSALDKKVDKEVAGETTVKTRQDLHDEMAGLIQSTPGLTGEQRTQLTTLRTSTQLKVDELSSQSLKLRSALIKELIATNYNEDEVELIKSRMKKVEDNRLSVTFNAVEQAKSILGHGVSENDQFIMDDFFGGHGSRDF